MVFMLTAKKVDPEQLTVQFLDRIIDVTKEVEDAKGLSWADR
jgi:hypothetical protein